MTERNLIRVSGGVTTAVWIGVSIQRGAQLDLSLLSSLGVVLAVVVFLMALLDRFLWRAPLLNVAFRRRRPLVRGTWRGQAASSRRDRPYDGFLVIDQTLSRVSVRMLTEDGSSETLASSWGESDDKNPAIFYVWRRFPKRGWSGRPAAEDEADAGFIHHGAGVLEICGSRPPKLRGPYWTDQGHIGEMTFNSHRPTRCQSYAEALTLFSERNSRRPSSLARG